MFKNDSCKLDVALWIMPDNKIDGYLEYLLFSALDSVKIDITSEATSIISKLKSKEYPEHHEMKAKLAIAMAMLENPGRNISHLINKNILCDDGGGNGTETQPKTYTVSFDADNGTEAVTQTVTEGGKAVKPSIPEKDGYNFDYWFNTAENAEWDFDTVVTADLSLKAKWTQKPPEPAPWNGSVAVTCSSLVESGQRIIT